MRVFVTCFESDEESIVDPFRALRGIVQTPAALRLWRGAGFYCQSLGALCNARQTRANLTQCSSATFSDMAACISVKRDRSCLRRKTVALQKGRLVRAVV